MPHYYWKYFYYSWCLYKIPIHYCFPYLRFLTGESSPIRVIFLMRCGGFAPSFCLITAQIPTEWFFNRNRICTDIWGRSFSSTTHNAYLLFLFVENGMGGFEPPTTRQFMCTPVLPLNYIPFDSVNLRLRSGIASAPCCMRLTSARMF